MAAFEIRQPDLVEHLERPRMDPDRT